jgi:hypothetical protein
MFVFALCILQEFMCAACAELHLLQNYSKGFIFVRQRTGPRASDNYISDAATIKINTHASELSNCSGLYMHVHERKQHTLLTGWSAVFGIELYFVVSAAALWLR